MSELRTLPKGAREHLARYQRRYAEQMSKVAQISEPKDSFVNWVARAEDGQEGVYRECKSRLTRGLLFPLTG